MTWIKPVRIALQVLALADVALLAIDWPHFGMTNKVLMLTVAGGAIGVSYVEHGRPRCSGTAAKARPACRRGGPSRWHRLARRRRAALIGAQHREFCFARAAAVS